MFRMVDWEIERWKNEMCISSSIQQGQGKSPSYMKALHSNSMYENCSTLSYFCISLTNDSHS